VLELRQYFAAFAGPANPAGRDADHQGIIRHISGYHGAGTDERVFADRMPADNGGIGADGGAFPDQGFVIILRAALRILTAGINDIGKDHRRPTENIILKCNAFIHGDVVLNFDEVADDDVVADVDVLPDGAFLADARTGLDMTEVPDAGAFPDRDLLINVAGFVNEIVTVTQSLILLCK